MKSMGLEAVNRSGAYFVVRRKKDVAIEVVERRDCNGTTVLADQIIRFSSRWSGSRYPHNLRMVIYYAAENNRTFYFLTNNFELPPETIALLYRERWQIETFFKWIKQHLRIDRFYGTSANAVMMQIYIAITAFCTLAIAADKCRYEGSLYDFSNIVGVSLNERVLLPELMARYGAVLREKSDLGGIIWPSLFPDL